LRISIIPFAIYPPSVKDVYYVTVISFLKKIFWRYALHQKRSYSEVITKKEIISPFVLLSQGKFRYSPYSHA